jgi:hypothetical protein
MQFYLKMKIGSIKRHNTIYLIITENKIDKNLTKYIQDI